MLTLLVLFGAMKTGDATPAPPFETETVLHSFSGGTGDGAVPEFGHLVGDAAGNLYGTTNEGGANAAGTVFRLAPPAPGHAGWTETILYSFTGAHGDGASPEAGLILDANGALYGTTAVGGHGGASCFTNNFFQGCGTVFKLSPPAPGNAAWTERILYAFNGPKGDGFDPESPLIMDAAGALYGTTTVGGACAANSSGCGIAFKLTPPAPGQSTWSETILHAFGAGVGDGNEHRRW